jgi:hypothetical protein
MAFSLCAAADQGAIEAMLPARQRRAEGSTCQDGERRWTGTMNLTEPQAGSDLAAVRTRADAAGRRQLPIFGQKIFITFGEHDLTDNIVHLVLARTPDAPEGVKGISLFLVPKFLVNADGSLGERNDVRCVSIEHKLGIHASPTCVLAFGDGGGAIGYLVGEENRGLEYMFIMMNEARFGVGLQGLGRGRARLPAGPGLCQGSRAGHRRHGPRARACHHPPPRRAPHADEHEVARRGDARAGLCGGRRCSTMAHPPSRRRGAPSACLRRSHDPDGQGLVHRDRHRGRLDSACRSTAAWASSRKPARRSTCATRASPRSTKAPRHPGQRPDRAQGAARRDAAFYRGKIATAYFYADCVLPHALAHAENVKAGDAALAGVSDALV